MPKKIEKALSPRFCQTAPVGRHCDGGGLYLQVTERKDGEGVSRSWLFRYRAGVRLRDAGLGSFPTVGLSDAREKARQMRLQRLDGVDPIQAKRDAKAAAEVAASRALTFRQCAEQLIEANAPGWKSAKHADQWRATLKTYAYPEIGDLPVAAVSDVHVVKVLTKDDLWTTKTETANRVRGRIERVLDRAKALKLRTGENPARWKGHLDQLLPARTQVAPVEHHAALPYSELPTFMVRLRALRSASARALEWTILTAARTSDTTAATWSEINMDEKTWAVPAARLKGRKGAKRRDHVVPLSDRAVEILAEMRGEGTEPTDYIFPGGNEGEPLSSMAQAEVLKGLGFSGDQATVHGFRSTFKDWAAEQTAYPNEMSEMALAHTVSDKVEAAYRRGDIREKRRRMMADWSTFAGTPSAPKGNTVVLIRAAH